MGNTNILNLINKWLVKVRTNLVIRNSFYNAFGFFIPFLINLLFTPLLVDRMGLEGYGLWHISISSLGLMGVLEFGLATAISKYVAEHKSKKDEIGLSAVITNGFVLNIIIGLLFSLPIYFLAPRLATLFPVSQVSIEQVAWVLRATAFGLLPLLLRNSALAIPRGLQRFEIPTLILTSQNALVVLVALVFTLAGGSVENVVFVTVFLMWVTAIGSLMWTLLIVRSLGVRIVFSWSHMRQMFSFMFFMGLGGMGRQLFTSVDKIVVGSVLGLSQVTYYTVSIGVANKFIAFSSTITQSLMPAASSWYAQKDFQKLWSYFKRSNLVLAVLNLGGVAILLLISKPFLRLWMGAEFAAYALSTFRVLLVVYAVMAITIPSAQIANGIGIPWINTVGALTTGVVTIVLIVVLGSRMGLIGTAWANAASWLKLVLPIYIGFRILKKTNSKPVS